jgi:hypothetical protein
MRSKSFVKRWVQPIGAALSIANITQPVPASAQSAIATYNYSTPVTPVIQASSYAQYAALGGLSTVIALRLPSYPSGILDGVWAAWKGGNTAGVTFYVFDKLPVASTCTDKMVFSMGAADIDKLALAPFSITPAVPNGSTFAIGEWTGTRSVANHDAATRTNKLYVCPVANSTVTPASTTDFVFKITGVAQD